MLRHGLNIRGLEDNGHGGVRPPDAADESLDRGPDVDLAGDDLEDLLDPDAEGGGLGEEGGHGGV